MICGVDEAGRGPVIGPLVVCALAVESDEGLVRLGVRDSKKLTPKRREELEPRIRSMGRVELRELQPWEIDALRERMSLNEIEAQVFASLIDRLAPSVVYLDAADTDEESFGRMVRAHLTCRPRICSEHKADAVYPVVSAASIVAKVVRDARIAEIERELGEPIGSGYLTDPVTVSFLRSYVERNGDLPPHTRRSWLPAKRLMSEKRLRRLDTFG